MRCRIACSGVAKSSCVLGESLAKEGVLSCAKIEVYTMNIRMKEKVLFYRHIVKLKGMETTK
jgi:hypothetical protein